MSQFLEFVQKMRYQIRHNASMQLRYLYTTSQPRVGYAEVTRLIIKGFILTKKIWVRNYFADFPLCLLCSGMSLMLQILFVFWYDSHSHVADFICVLV